VSRNIQTGVLPRFIHVFFFKLACAFVYNQSALKIRINLQHRTMITVHVFEYSDSIYNLRNVWVKLSKIAKFCIFRRAYWKNLQGSKSILFMKKNDFKICQGCVKLCFLSIVLFLNWLELILIGSFLGKLGQIARKLSRKGYNKFKTCHL
jgi:hypothetical protein